MTSQDEQTREVQTTSAQRVKAWIFTLNNPPVSSDGMPRVITSSTLPTTVQYLVYQLERADTGTCHLQGYVVCKRKCAMSSLKTTLAHMFGTASPTAHVEPRRGTHKQAKEYCMKADSRVKGPWEAGKEPKQGDRSDLKALVKAIRDDHKRPYELVHQFGEKIIKYHRGISYFYNLCFEHEARAKLRKGIRVCVITGPTGCGKTRLIYEKHDPKEVFFLTINEKCWFDGYEGEKILVLDDFYGNIKYHYLLRLLDIYPCRCEVKGSFTWADWDMVYITSNQSPNAWYKKLTGDTGECPAALWRRITSWVEMQEDGSLLVMKAETAPIIDVSGDEPIVDDVDEHLSQASAILADFPDFTS